MADTPTIYHVQPELLREGRIDEQPDIRYDAVEVVPLADYDALLRSTTDQTILFGLAVKHLDGDGHARFLAEPKVKELLDSEPTELPNGMDPDDKVGYGTY